jgi:anti-anti-sigma factor
MNAPGPLDGVAEPMSALHTQRREDGDTVVLVLHGELDITTLSDAERDVAAAESAGSDLVLDLGQLRFCDSSGVRLVLLADERARVEGRRLAIELGDGPAQRVFAALGLIDRLNLRARTDGAATGVHPGTP